MTKTALALVAGCALSLAATEASDTPGPAQDSAVAIGPAAPGETAAAPADQPTPDASNGGPPAPDKASVGIEAPEDVESSATANRLQAAYERMVRLMEEERYAEAKAAAQAVVTLTEQQSGPDDMELVAPLANLATTQMMDGDLKDAANNYQRSIAIIKQTEGMLTPRLINPYVGLGATYNRAQLYDKAEEAFQTALRINHVNEGFYNLDQIRIRDGLTESFIGLDDFEEANFHQAIQLEISQRRYGEEDPQVAPAMYKLARWYERAGLIEEARYTYQRAQRLIRRSDGRDSPEMIAALEGMAGTYERQGLLGESASRLKQALEIVEAQPEIDRPKQAELLIRLGDLFLGSGRADTANAYYEQAWQALSAEPPYEDLRERYFAQPARVAGLGWRTLRFGPGVRGDAPDLLEGFVLVRYDVDTDGRTENVAVVESEPVDLMDDRVTSALKRSYFRPRYTDGIAALAEGQLYRHDFRYRPEQSRDKKESSEPLEPPPADNGRIDYPGSDDS